MNGFQNEPNPWGNQTAIKFSLAKKGNIVITFYDVNGKKMFTRTGDFEAGLNEMIISKNDLNNTSGLIYYKIESSEFSENGTMIHLK